MKSRKSAIIMAGLLYLLLAAMIYTGYLIHGDPARFEGLSPFSSAGPATRGLSGVAASIGSVAAPWPDWATARDKENFDRAMKTMRSGESRKFMTAMMTFQDELEERGHGALELKGVALSGMAGEVIATALTPVVFAVLMTIAFILASSTLSRTGANPLDYLLVGAGYLLGVAGIFLFRVALAGGDVRPFRCGWAVDAPTYKSALWSGGSLRLDGPGPDGGVAGGDDWARQRPQAENGPMPHLWGKRRRGQQKLWRRWAWADDSDR